MQQPSVVSLNGGFVHGATSQEPRTFAVAERFTVQCDQLGGPRPVAFKPSALYLSEQPVEARAWQIHDIRVNGRTQLDGDEIRGDMFSYKQPYSQALTSGFDTIAIGGALEIDLSFQGTTALRQAPFHAGLFGFEVNSNEDVTAYSSPIRFRGPNGKLIATTGDGPARVLPGESAWFVARPRDVSFRAKRLTIDCCCQDWLLEDLHVNNQTQFLHSDPIPGEIFHPNALDTFVRLNTTSPDKPLAIRARYVGSNPRGGRFGIVAYGTTAS